MKTIDIKELIESLGFDKVMYSTFAKKTGKSEDELTRDSFMPVSQEMKGEIHQDCSQRDPRP